MTVPTIIVFGPTGNVGSSAATAAHALGAKVVLALRDLQKPIPGLSADDEGTGRYERVPADLSQPATVEAAVKATGATHAFIYNLHGADVAETRTTLEALKRSGVSFVVFLSTAVVRGDVHSITPADGFIAWMHARTEVALSEVFGNGGYVALRPAYFITNSRLWAHSLRSGDVRMPYPNVELDWIAPVDIGKVAAKLLVHGSQAAAGANHVVLFGPKLISQRDAVAIAARVIGVDVSVTAIDAEEAVQTFVKGGLLEPIARSVVSNLGDYDQGKSGITADFEEGSANLHKYVDQPLSFENWVKENKSWFS